MLDCVAALHEKGIVRVKDRLSVKKNKRVLKKKQTLVICVSKRPKGKDRNACPSSLALSRVLEIACIPLTESKLVAKTDGLSGTCVRIFIQSADNDTKHTYVLDVRNEPPQECNSFVKVFGCYTMRNNRCYATQKQMQRFAGGGPSWCSR